MTENEISKIILDKSIQIQKNLGRGLLESAYEQCLAYELEQAGLRVLRQQPIPLNYKELKIEDAYRTDIVVEDSVIIELKAVKQLEETHYVQLTTYLKLSGKRLGLLINFNAPTIKEGFVRIVNGL